MYAVMRKYKVAGTWDAANQIITNEFIPVIKAIDGFRAYRTVNLGDGFIASFTLFDSKAGADQATQKAREWIASSASAKAAFPTPPEVLAGEVGVNVSA